MLTERSNLLRLKKTGPLALFLCQWYRATKQGTTTTIMKFFQKRSVVDIGENKNKSRRKRHADYNINIMDNNNDDYDEQQHNVITPSIEVEYPNNRQSLSELVRKLNCSASMKSNNNDDDYDDDNLQQSFSVVGGGRRDTKSRSDSYLPNQSFSFRSQQHQQQQQQQQQQKQKQKQMKQQQWVPSSSQITIGESSSNITRPVLITVKDGGNDVDGPCSDAASSSPLKDHTNTMSVSELTSSFIVGDLHHHPHQHQQQKSSSSVNVNNKTNNNNNNNNSLSLSPFRKIGMSARKRDSKNESSFVTPNKQEIARKERWRRGIEIEMEKRMSREKDNNTNSNTRTGSRSTSRSAGEGDGGAAAAAAAAASGGDRDDNSSIYADSNTQGSHTTGNTTDFSSIGDWTDVTDDTRMGRRRGHCSSSQHVAESVAEDFGILAKLLLNDGYACLGTAADITRETICSQRS